MAQNIGAETKLAGFVTKLASLGYEVREVSKKPQIYSINGEPVNIRSRSKHRNAAYGRSFWYDIPFSVLHGVTSVVYLMTESDYFVKFPATFLESVKDRIYLAENKAGVGVFDIDWDNPKIVLKQGEVVGIGQYYHNLTEPECYPEF
jgi:hypothetical protein